MIFKLTARDARPARLRAAHANGGFMRFGPFLLLAILLAILWVGGFVFFHVAGFLIHLLLIFAVISFVVHLFAGARTA